MKNSKDLNRCPVCNGYIAISGSNVMFCPNDDCGVEIIGKLEYTRIEKLSELTTEADTSNAKLNRPSVIGSALLNDILKGKEDIISSPLRFVGVGIEHIRATFIKYGVKCDTPF